MDHCCNQQRLEVEFRGEKHPRSLSPLPFIVACLYIKEVVADVARNDYTPNLMEYDLAVTNTQLQRHSEGEEAIIIPNTFEVATRVTKAQHRKAASHKEMKSLQKLGVYSLVRPSDILSGMEAIRSR